MFRARRFNRLDLEICRVFEMQICNVVALCCRFYFVLPNLRRSSTHFEELRLDLPHLDSNILQLSEFANLKSISLSCATYGGEIEELLYWPQLENLHIANLKGQDLVSSSCKGALLACLGPGLKSEVLACFMSMHRTPHPWGCVCALGAFS